MSDGFFGKEFGDNLRQELGLGDDWEVTMVAGSIDALSGPGSTSQIREDAEQAYFDMDLDPDGVVKLIEDHIVSVDLPEGATFVRLRRMANGEKDPDTPPKYAIVNIPYTAPDERPTPGRHRTPGMA